MDVYSVVPIGQETYRTILDQCDALLKTLIKQPWFLCVMEKETETCNKCSFDSTKNFKCILYMSIFLFVEVSNRIYLWSLIKLLKFPLIKLCTDKYIFNQAGNTITNICNVL